MYQDIMDTIGFVEKYDSEVGQAMDKELKRQQRNLELIASENIVSPAVMAAMGSILTNKYAEGYPGKRYYGGCEFVDIVEDIARKRACELFGAEHANVQPHSGAQANAAAQGSDLFLSAQNFLFAVPVHSAEAFIPASSASPFRSNKVTPPRETATHPSC